MSKEELVKYVKSPNICDELSDDQIGRIGRKVSDGFQKDLDSMSLWFNDVEESVKLTTLKKEPKNTPFQNAANIKYPLITNACYQFAANTYPEIVKDGKIVKTAVLGTDFENSKVERGNRVADFMNYQLLFQTTEWEEGLDKLLNILPNIGLMFRKTYYDPNRKMVCSDVCDYKDIILDAKCSSLKAVRRISHILKYSMNDLVEYSRTGLFNEKAVDSIIERYSEIDTIDHIVCIEQHNFLDLDGDGYEEPYIVTIEKDTGNVLRIVARFEKEGIKENKKGIYLITPVEYFTDFHFLPNPDGSFLSVGFGTLMMHLNMSINTILNQLIDAGSLRNMQGGYIDSRLKMNSGLNGHNPGEWKKVTPASGTELSQSFFPLNYQEPSNVLLQLLGMLIQAGKELSSSTDAMQGSVMPDNAKTGAVSSIIERGLKVFNSIQRRFYRSEKNELQKIFDINSRYLDEKTYFTVLDDDKAVLRTDFNRDDLDIMPVADPNLSSDTQRLAQIQILQSLKNQPGVDNREIDMRTLQYARVQDPEKILPPPDPNQPPPPDVIKMQAELTEMAAEGSRKDRELSMKQQELELAAAKLPKELAKIESETVKNLAQAEAAEAGSQLAQLKQMADQMLSKNDQIIQLMQMKNDQQQMQQGAPNEQQPPAPPSMGEPSDDAGVPGQAPGLPPQ